MAFESFLSYAHLDDADPNKWIQQFHKSIELRLTILNGKKVNVFFDLRNEDGFNISTNIKQSINSSKTLIIVLSPLYIYSEWCAAERELFIKNNQGKYNNIVIVEKVPTSGHDYDFLHPEIRKYSLYDHDEITYESHHKPYKTAIHKLCKEIINNLRESNNKKTHRINISSNNHIDQTLLSNFENDINIEDTQLKRFYLGTVLSDIPKEGFFVFLFEFLKDDDFKQHLVQFRKFLEQIQNADKAQILIWVNPNFEKSNIYYEGLNNLLMEFENGASFDIAQTSLEDFKSILSEYAHEYFQ